MGEIEYVATDRDGLSVCAMHHAHGKWSVTLGRFPHRRVESPYLDSLAEVETWLRIERVTLTSAWAVAK